MQIISSRKEYKHWSSQLRAAWTFCKTSPFVFHARKRHTRQFLELLFLYLLYVLSGAIIYWDHCLPWYVKLSHMWQWGWRLLASLPSSIPARAPKIWLGGRVGVADSHSVWLSKGPAWRLSKFMVFRLLLEQGVGPGQIRDEYGCWA